MSASVPTKQRKAKQNKLCTAKGKAQNRTHLQTTNQNLKAYHLLRRDWSNTRSTAEPTAGKPLSSKAPSFQTQLTAWNPQSECLPPHLTYPLEARVVGAPHVMSWLGGGTQNLYECPWVSHGQVRLRMYFLDEPTVCSNILTVKRTWHQNYMISILKWTPS